jgi:hypothetical protein
MDKLVFCHPLKNNAEPNITTAKAIHSVEKETIREAALVNGHPRYYMKPVTINDKSFLIMNDLYEKNVKPFNAWVKSVRPVKA